MYSGTNLSGKLATGLFICLLPLLLLNCGCPADIKQGEIRLIRPDFLQLTGSESMTFTNQTTSKTTLFQGVSPGYSTNKLITATLCSKPPISNQVRYYESVPFATKTYRGSGSDYQLSYFYNIYDPVQGDTMTYIDLLSIDGYRIDLRILVSDRGKPGVHTLPLVQVASQFRIIADTVLNNQRYQQVYCQARSPTVFFTRNRGVVAFQRDGDWWYLTGFK